MVRQPYTLDEIRGLLPKLEKELDEYEKQDNVRPLPLMNIEEARELAFQLIDAAEQKPLTREQALLFSQLLCSYEMAVRADMMQPGKRCLVVTEDQLQELGDRLLG